MRARGSTAVSRAGLRRAVRSGLASLALVCLGCPASQFTATDDGGELALPCPELPPDLETYLVGDPADADVSPTGPAWLLAGGVPAPTAALKWWSQFVAGGDVVILRTSGEDKYLEQFWTELGPVDSVEILVVTSRAHAEHESVSCRLARAEGIFIAGGWQNTYLDDWGDSPVTAAISEAWARGAAIGGNSAGLAVMGEYIYGVHAGSIVSAEALADPYHPKLTLDREFLAMPLGAGILFDTHFTERERMGRSVAFLARIVTDGWATTPIAIGIDEDTALTVDAGGRAEVQGSGSVYVLRPGAPPTACLPGEPLVYEDVAVHALEEGDLVSLPDGTTDVEPYFVSAVDGALEPASP